MLTTLALETSTEACSVALAVGDSVHERHEVAGRHHTEIVFELIDAVLADAGVTRDTLGLVAFGCGPGSFTGVRLAASLAQGIAFAGGSAVAPVPTLRALAAGARRLHDATSVACALDARREEIYAGAWTFGNGEVTTILDTCVIAPAALVLPGGTRWVAAGNGWDRYAGAFDAALAIEPCGLEHPRAHDVAVLGQAMHTAGETVEPRHAAPVYLRRGVD